MGLHFRFLMWSNSGRLENEDGALDGLFTIRATCAPKILQRVAGKFRNPSEYGSGKRDIMFLRQKKKMLEINEILS